MRTEMPETEFNLPFFMENDFVRRKCKICQCDFWTQNPERDNCGDAPCQPYTFLNNSPTKRPFTLEEMRETFLSFFEKNAHERIKPYPVIARWREDLFVTIASIADFQPHVTEGIIPPPANPLVISQPCLRFNDIDNVGLTGGRHMTIFEMGGAHAFNYPDKQVYWKNETIRLHHEFVVKMLGIPSELVTYKEGIWSGGGNAGPDVEGCICGLEVSTLVFMQYKVVGSQFIDMPIKIVDTGYGMERFTWLSQGSPSGFHSIYGAILDKVVHLAELEQIDEKLMAENTRYSALMNVETLSDRMALRKKVADKLGMNQIELDRIMIQMESVYAILDHTKALIFMLAEGVVPSNVRVGYLTRLLIRKTYRLLRGLGIENKLLEIIEMQMERWSKDFPQIKEMSREIYEGISIEEGKYRVTLNRGIDLSRKIVAEVKSKGEKEIPIERVIELYDSHGISPEIFEETVKNAEVKVKIPENFYAMIAQRHVAPQAMTSEQAISSELKQLFSGLEPTRLLYYDEPEIKEFEARILTIIQGKYVILDRTFFYPKSGGQDADHGFFEVNGTQTRVIDVLKIGNVVAHMVEDPMLMEGSKIVKGIVDWDRRTSLMTHHTSTHIVLGAARRVLGQHVWQAGAQKEVEKSRLDISHWKRITSEQTREIETLANQVVMANLPVEVSWMPRGEAEENYGFRLYQGGVVPGARVRIVKIGDWDVEACGGIHVESTGKIGLIKILHTERIQDGVERIIFSAGYQALNQVHRIEDTLQKAAETLDVTPDKLTQAVEEKCTEINRLAQEVERLRDKEMEYTLLDMLHKAKKVKGLLLTSHVTTMDAADAVIKILRTIVKKEPRAVAIMFGVNDTVRVFVMAGEVAVNQGVDSGTIAAAISNTLGGGGGGKPSFGQGGGNKVKKVEEAITMVETILRTQIVGDESIDS